MGVHFKLDEEAYARYESVLDITGTGIMGYVQIPCIERNAFVAQKAQEAALYALFSDGRHMVSFDDVVKTMMETGRDMQAKYRETSLGGLATVCVKNWGLYPGKMRIENATKTVD